MQYLLKLIFNEEEILNNNYVKKVEIFNDLGIKDIILETNEEITEINDAIKKALG